MHIIKSLPFSTKFLLGARNKFRRGATRETTIRWEGGVRCDLIYPFIHQNESKAESQDEAFRALFRD